MEKKNKRPALELPTSFGNIFYLYSLLLSHESQHREDGYTTIKTCETIHEYNCQHVPEKNNKEVAC